MARYTIFAVIAALCLTTTTADLTSASFANGTVGKVFDGSTSAADVSTWGTYTVAKFGPGTDNTTVWAYGIKYTSATSITTVAARKLNATLLSNTTNAGVGDATMTSDATYTTTISITSDIQTAVGLGFLGIAYVAADSSSCSQVYVSVFTGGSLTVTKAVTAYTCVTTSASSSTTCVSYTNTVNSLFYENGTFYVAYTSTKVSAAYDSTVTTGSTIGCSASTSQLVTGYLQGVAAASAGTWTWTAAVAFYTGTASTAGNAASPTAATISPMCGPQNYTNSTNFYCTYTDASSTGNIKAVKITVASGAADSGTTIATSTAYSAASSSAVTYNAYTVAGFVYGMYQQGILLNNAASNYAASGTSVSSSANTLQLYNLTSGATTTSGATAGGIALTGYSNAVSGQTFGGAGITYSQGYAILDSYTASTTTTYQFAPFFANSSTNGSQTTVAAQNPGAGNWFVDANGALWFGGYTTSSSLLTTGYLGKEVGQIYYSAGNILASFVALLSVMIAALFAF